MYQFDDAYTKYAYDGRAINDEQVRILSNCPSDFKLVWVFYQQQKYIAIYRGICMFGEKPIFYWIECIPNYTSNKRDAICFNLNDLISGNVLMNNDYRDAFLRFKRAIEHRNVAYKTIEESYLIEEVYSCI